MEYRWVDTCIRLFASFALSDAYGRTFPDLVYQPFYMYDSQKDNLIISCSTQTYQPINQPINQI